MVGSKLLRKHCISVLDCVYIGDHHHNALRKCQVSSNGLVSINQSPEEH